MAIDIEQLSRPALGFSNLYVLIELLGFTFSTCNHKQSYFDFLFKSKKKKKIMVKCFSKDSQL